MTRQSCSTPIYIKQSVTEHDGRTTTYTYDGMGRTVKMEYPHGWVEDYHYDSIGQLLKVEDTDPSGKDMKQQKHVYEYDDCGNMTYEYMRGNGTGEATVENFYTYDALHRVTNAKENYGNASRTYQYDSLGNLTWETNSNNVTTDYKLNNLNQITEKSSDGWKTHTTFTYDKRGNLIQEQYGKNKKVTSIGTYTYDETNKMVKGVNANAESSSYLYNGLGALVEQTWVIAKNSYGYHDVLAEAVDSVAEEPETAGDPVDSPEVPAPSDDNTTETDAALDEAPADSADSGIMLLASSNKDHSGKKPSDKPTGSDVKKTSTVVKEFVVDYTTETHEPLMEQEVNGLTYRYVYGNDRLSVNITGVENGSSKLIENGNQIRLYYHMDYLGTADYLTSPQTGKVESWTHYNEWGEITHNAVLKCGQRELDLVKRYATHDFDAVLNQYYAKARFYDAENRHFTAMDPILDPSQYSIKEYVDEPVQLVQYLYVANNPVNEIDPLGLITGSQMEAIGKTYVGCKRHHRLASFIAASMLSYPISPLSFGHNVAQIIAYTQYANVYSNSDIKLEYSIDESNRADILIIQKMKMGKQKAYVGEVKPASHLRYTRYNKPAATLTAAKNQLGRYMSILVCEMSDNRQTYSSVQPLGVGIYSRSILLETLGILAPKRTYEMIVQTKGAQGLIGYEVKRTIGRKTETVPVPQLHNEFLVYHNLQKREEATVQTLQKVRQQLGAAVKTVTAVAVGTVVVAGVAYLTVQTGGAILTFAANAVPVIKGATLAQYTTYALATFSTGAAPQLLRFA